MKRLVTPGDTRAPGVRVFAGGQPFGGVVSAEITNTSHSQAAQYRLHLALNDPRGQTMAWWGDDARKGLLIEIQVGLAGQYRSLIVGEADRIDLLPASGMVSVEGRDLAARLIEASTQETFLNQTASQIATTLAQRHGLKPVVTATTTPVSRYYSNDHDKLTHNQFARTHKEWELLTFLAQNEGFGLFVVRDELHFEPVPDPAKAEPYGIRWSQETRIGDVANLALHRSLTLAKDVVVVVRSWESAKGKGYSVSSPPGKANKSASDKVQQFVYIRPNLTHDQAHKLADSLRADITAHERTISFDCPGELDLTPRDIIQLSGCGRGWDQRYFVNTVTRSISVEQGFVQRVTGKNHYVESGVGSL
ncbi:MAG: hypothetical protein NVSMB20_03160 [Bradyrhizobium sp.]